MKKISTFKYLVLLGAVIGVFGFAAPASAAVDSDNDSVIDVVEDSSTPNAGDNNYDGTDDSIQNDVATITNPNDIETPDAFVTLELEGEVCDGDYVCPSDWKIDEFKAVDVASLPSQPDDKVFPLGMFDIKLSCQQYNRGNIFFDAIDNGYNACVERELVHTEEGCEWVETPIPANLKLIFDRVMDTSNWTMEKYDPITDTYIDYSPYVTVSNQYIGYLRTVLEWSIYDGGLGDSDGIVNGYISDPIGPSIPVEPAKVKPAVATTTTGPALANTGVNSMFALLAGVFFVLAGAVLLPKRV